MRFYNVKKKETVVIKDSKCKAVAYERKGQYRYAIRAIDNDGTKLTKFVNKQTYDQYERFNEKEIVETKPQGFVLRIMSLIGKQLKEIG